VKKELEVSPVGHDTYLLTRINSRFVDMCSSCSTETVHRLAIGLAASSYASPLCEDHNDHCYQDCQKRKTAKGRVTGVFGDSSDFGIASLEFLSNVFSRHSAYEH